MKSFVMTFDDEGKSRFNDRKDKASYERLLSSVKNSADGKAMYVMTISEYKPSTTGKQIKLWNVLIDFIAMETGQPNADVEETLISNYSKTKVFPEHLNNTEFQALLDKSINFCNEFFNLNIQFNAVGHIEIKKL